MNAFLDRRPVPASQLAPVPGQVIAIHCSASGPWQWRALSAACTGLGAVHGPALLDGRHAAARDRSRAFSLDEEAAPLLAAVEQSSEPVHLVGHSYGGAVALRIAASARDRIASLTLYEPVVFALLGGANGCPSLLAEIEDLADTVCDLVEAGHLAAAAQLFVDYWNGPGSYVGSAPQIRGHVCGLMAKCALEFAAIRAAALSELIDTEGTFPVLVVAGASGPRPAREMALRLVRRLPAARFVTMRTAGHMGPVTHAEEFAALCRDFIAAARMS